MVLRKLAMALLSIGVILPGLTHALALRDVKTKSALGEPFRAELELSDLGDLSDEDIKWVEETLEGLKGAEGQQIVNGIFAAVPYCIDLIGGPYIETNESVCKAFRPKSAIRPAKS